MAMVQGSQGCTHQGRPEKILKLPVKLSQPSAGIPTSSWPSGILPNKKPSLGKPARRTSEGTVTILILADQIADPEHHKAKYAELYMQSPVAYFDTGMAAGLMNITAYGMGYSTLFLLAQRNQHHPGG